MCSNPRVGQVAETAGAHRRGTQQLWGGRVLRAIEIGHLTSCEREVTLAWCWTEEEVRREGGALEGE